jgi:hypothetical protein
MSEALQTRLRDELQAIRVPPVDHRRLMAAGRQRARRRALRTRGAAAACVLALAAAATQVWPQEAATTITDSPPASAPGPTPPGDQGPPVEGLVDGAFEPIEGMGDGSGLDPLAPEDAQEISRAEYRLLGTCMAQKGLVYDAPSIGSVPPMYLSPSELRRDGYRYDWAAAAQDFLGASSPDGAGRATAGMTAGELAEYDEALFGDVDERVTLGDLGGGTIGSPAGGCMGEARAALYGSVANFMRYDRVVETLSHWGIGSRLQEYDAYREPLTAWQECMRARNHDVGGDTDYGTSYIQSSGAVALSDDGAGQTLVTGESIAAVADADADCQESSGLYEVREALLPQAREDLAAALGFEMSQYVAYQHAVYERAQQVP